MLKKSIRPIPTQTMVPPKPPNCQYPFLKDDGQETVGALDLSKSKQAELGRDAQDSEKLEQK